ALRSVTRSGRSSCATTRDACCASPTREVHAMTDTPTDEVVYDVEPSGVAWIVLNRPDAGNALTREQRRRIQDRLEEAGDALGVRAIVLTASGDRHFCTGGALRVAAQATAPPPGAPKLADAPDKPVGTVMRGLETSLGAQRF